MNFDMFVKHTIKLVVIVRINILHTRHDAYTNKIHTHTQETFVNTWGPQNKVPNLPIKNIAKITY